MPLITATEYKLFAGIGDTGQDSDIAAMIPIVEAAIAKRLNRQLDNGDGTTEHTEYFDGDGLGSVIWPKYFPIVSITSLHDDPDRGYGDAYLISSDDYVAYDGKVALDGLIFCKGLKNIKLVYVGGYVTSGASANTPSDLKGVVMAILKWNMERKTKLSIVSESNSQQNVNRSFAVEIPKELMRQLAPYRRWVF